MTEEDTFLKLKKLSFSEALQRYKEFGKKAIAGNDIEEFFAGIGWSEEEFYWQWKERTEFKNV